MMAELRDEHGIKAISEAFGCSASGLYRARRRHVRPGPQAASNNELLVEIRKIHKTHKSRYGSPRIAMELRRKGYVCGTNRVARLMRAHGIKGLRAKRKTPRTTDSRHGGRVAPNLLKSLDITRPNQAWAMDITYLKAGGDWVYLAAVLDLFTHEIVGWQIATHMRSELVEEALRNAVARTAPAGSVLIHSDRGSQYCSDEFIGLAKDFGMVRSMSAKGNCYDNATMESFFGVLKREELDRMQLADLKEARAVVFGYIEGYYNTRRLHTTLGMTPSEFAESWNQDDAAPAAEFSEHGDLPKSEEKRPESECPLVPTHGRTSGYPSGGCSPAEPPSVSPNSISDAPNLIDVETKLN